MTSPRSHACLAAPGQGPDFLTPVLCTITPLERTMAGVQCEAPREQEDVPGGVWSAREPGAWWPTPTPVSFGCRWVILFTLL